MFSAQAGQIANALKSAGLSPDAAQKIAAILGNGVQNMVRTNPETVDLTPQSMRYVTPDVRKYELQELDFRQADPYFRPSQGDASEARRVPQQAESVRSDPSPQSTDATYRVKGGRFTDVKGTGDSAQVDLRVAGFGRGVLLDPQGNTLLGKNFRCEADDSGLRFFIEETGTELVWRLQFADFFAVFGEEIEVIVGASLDAGSLVFEKRRVRVLAVADAEPDNIPTAGCPT